MTTQEIEQEVRRLAPWYYSFDLRGVKTDITPPFDHWGHRTVDIPDDIKPFLHGKTILDVGCNEGGYAFAALRHGAKSVLGIDCRRCNIEKANFVAQVLRADNAAFQVGSADSWSSTEAYDIVFLCGLLYHLPEPWNTIRKYCEVAREGVFVTTMLYGSHSDGYSSWRESDSIGASENPINPSMPPNTVKTVVTEFRQYAFAPTHLIESRFLAPSRFSALGGRLDYRLNQSRARLLNRIDPVLKGSRGHQRIHMPLASASAPFSGSASFLFRRVSTIA
jgi:SAM-dependent methyltransferase